MEGARGAPTSLGLVSLYGLHSHCAAFFPRGRRPASRQAKQAPIASHHPGSPACLFWRSKLNPSTNSDGSRIPSWSASPSLIMSCSSVFSVCIVSFPLTLASPARVVFRKTGQDLVGARVAMAMAFVATCKLVFYNAETLGFRGEPCSDLWITHTNGR